MARISFPLDLFGLSGVKALEFPQTDATPQLDGPVGTREMPVQSLLGGFVIDNLRFEAGQWTGRDGQVQTYEGLTLETVLLSVSQSKNIVQTRVAGAPGTVKEYIADGDFNVRMWGTLQRTENVYPQDEIERLVALMQVPASIEVVSPFLQLFGINLLTISEYSFTQKEGYENQQPFQITALSDRDVQLVIATDETP